MNGDLLNVKEAGERLRISRATLYSLIKAGKIKPVKIGKRTLFTEDELSNFIERMKKESQ